MSAEASECFPCFGGTVTVQAAGGPGLDPGAAVSRARARLLEAHDLLSRFEPDSELSRLNRDPRGTVPVSPLLLELAVAVRRAGALSGGLVDATQLEQIERAGYRESLDGRAARAAAAAVGTERDRLGPARPRPERAWRRISVDRAAGTVSRPPGVTIDSGGIAKGLMADLVAATLRDHPAFAVNCCGDARIGGSEGRPRVVLVEDPLGGPPLHELSIRDGGVATSGITRRAWTGEDGSARHHLLDPSTGRPAFTGIVQATALAPTAFLAEVHAKHALLSGPAEALTRLPYGGVLVHADGAVEIAAPKAPSPIAVLG